MRWSRYLNLLGTVGMLSLAMPATAQLRLPAQVRAMFPAKLQQSLRQLMAAMQQQAANQTAERLYREQQAQLREALAEAASLGVGEFAYFFHGAKGLGSGDFIDAVSLSDGRMLIRSGDVMGHGWQAAITSFALQKFWRSPAVAVLLDDVYTATRGLVDALGVLETLLHRDDKDDFTYFTMTSTIVDPHQKTLTSLFAGEGAFYLIRDNPAGEPTVQEIYSDAATTTFVPFSIEAISAYEQAANAAPHEVSYQSGDLLVYFSDGLLERQVIGSRDAEGQTSNLSDILPHLLSRVVEQSRENGFTAEFAADIFTEIIKHSQVIMPDDCSILAIKLQ